jgi:hypothetical protein
MTRKSIPWAVAWAAIALLAACQSSTAPPPPEPPRQVETGSRFNLLAPLAFPAGRDELFFQNQRQISAAAVTRDQPLCWLVPQPGAARNLPPGPLTVGNVMYDRREIGTTGAVQSVTRIDLAPAAGRPGYTLSCGLPAGAPSGGFVSSEQIFNAIGGQFSMDLLR